MEQITIGRYDIIKGRKGRESDGKIGRVSTRTSTIGSNGESVNGGYGKSEAQVKKWV